MIPALASTIIALLVFLVIGVAQPDFGELSSWVDDVIVRDPNLPGAIYNGAIRPFWEQRSSYNVVLWTMGIELWGSFLVYLFCFGQRYIRSIVCVLGAALAILAAGIFDPRLAFGLSCFMIGLGFYKLNIRISILPLAIFVLLLGIYFSGVHNNSVFYPFAGYLFGHHGYLLINIASAPLVVLGVLSLPKVQTWLERPALVTLGKRSFAIYLIHLPVLYVSITVVELISGYQENYVIKAFAVSAAVVVLSIALAKQMYKVDQIAMRVAKKIHK